MFLSFIFPVVLNRLGILDACFQILQKLECTCRSTAETQLAVPDAQEGEEMKGLLQSKWR